MVFSGDTRVCLAVSTAAQGADVLIHEALSTEDAHGQNVAIGYRALKTLNAGGDAHNTAVGD